MKPTDEIDTTGATPFPAPEECSERFMTTSEGQRFTDIQYQLDALIETVQQFAGVLVGLDDPCGRISKAEATMRELKQSAAYRSGHEVSK